MKQALTAFYKACRDHDLAQTSAIAIAAARPEEVRPRPNYSSAAEPEQGWYRTSNRGKRP